MQMLKTRVVWRRCGEGERRVRRLGRVILEVREGWWVETVVLGWRRMVTGLR